MNPQIYPHQFNLIKQHILHLANVYKSVNDLNVIASIQEETQAMIIDTLGKTDDTILKCIDEMMDIRISKHKIERIFNELENYVIPFKAPSQKQFEKVFRKVKKLKTPLITDNMLLSSTFLGWNDISTNRKYFVYYDMNQQLKGFYGEISTQTQKGFCSICNKESKVSLFLKKTNSSSDGRYTKKGNYICHDSEQCNKQLTDLQYFYSFLDQINE